MREYGRILDQIEERSESRIAGTGERFSSGAFATEDATISEVISPSEFTVQEMPGQTFRLAGITDRPLLLDHAGVETYQDLGDRMLSMVGQTVEMTYGGTGKAMPAILDDVNAKYMTKGLERSQLTALGHRAKHGAGGLPAAFEQLLHAPTVPIPGLNVPIEYFRNKWVGQSSPIEEYEELHVFGTANTN